MVLYPFIICFTVPGVYFPSSFSLISLFQQRGSFFFSSSKFCFCISNYITFVPEYDNKVQNFLNNMQEKSKINTDISVRISIIIEYLKLTPNSFAKKLGYERSQTLYDIINQKSAPSFDFFYKFCVSEFSALIDIEWLISGNGNYKKEENHLIAFPKDNTKELEMIRDLAAENALLKKENEELKLRGREHSHQYGNLAAEPELKQSAPTK